MAIGGKALRRSHDRAKGKAALHLVSAWADASGLVLGQVAVDEKANEIVAIPALLRLLDVRGCTVCSPARTTTPRGTMTRAIFAEARATAFSPLAPAHHDHARATGKGHGRLRCAAPGSSAPWK